MDAKKLEWMRKRLELEKKRNQIDTVRIRIKTENYVANYEETKWCNIDPEKFAAVPRKGEIGILIQVGSFEDAGYAAIKFGDTVGVFNIDDVSIYVPMTMKTRLCAHCEKTLLTTSSVQKVHDECRIAYYNAKKSHRNATRGFYPYGAQIRLARARIIIGEPCIACRYDKGIRRRPVLYPEGLKKINLCLNCLSEIRTGQMELITWKKLIPGGSNHF